MNENTPLPRIRYLEAHPFQQEGRPMYLLRDPTGYTIHSFSVTPEMIFIFQFLDGEHTFGQLQREFERRHRQYLNPDDMEQVIGMLDDQHLLDNERFAQMKEKIDEEFVKSPIRPFSCFDPADDPEPVRRLLDQAFAQAGYPPGPNIEPEGKPLAGIIAPHIDFSRGARIYARAYGAFLSRFVAGPIVILGTNHQPTDNPVILCDKDFDTLFGRVPTAKLIVHEIARKMQGKPFADLIAHRKEHSIELAATMIAYADRTLTTTIVPVLIGGVGSLIEQGKRPGDIPEIRSLIEALREVAEREPGGMAVIASADLAHVGRQFGDPFKLDEYHMKQLEQKDVASLAFVESGDADGFFDFIAAEKDERKVCGLGPIFTTLAALSPVKGARLGYEQWLAPDRDGSVTFCAMTLEK